MSDIYGQLAAVQLELKAPKGQRNSFGNYDYRSAEDILEAVKPLLNDNGLTLIVDDSIELIGDRYYVKATATVFNGAGETVSSNAYAREADDKKGMDSAQVTGATSSYARKYALNGLFAIDDAKDADTDEHKKQSDTRESTTSNRPKASANNPATEKQIELIKQLATKAGHGSDWVAAVIMKINSSADASAVIEKLKGASHED